MIKKTIQVLLSEIVDYAGLFPPAKLPMAAAAANFAEYKNSEYGWMLGRFVVAVSRLAEFTENAEKFFSRDEKIWRLSILADEEISETARKIKEFNRAFAGKAIIDAIEAKADSVSEIEILSAHLPVNADVYAELPLDENLPDLIKAVAAQNLRAKIRTGGITPEAFPTIEKIIEFMRRCIAADVPFKATAGLHHPLRCLKPLTYEKDAPEGTMNGFLNLFLTAAFLCQNPENDFSVELMKETAARNFVFTDESILWKNHTVSLHEIEFIRRNGAISFGSCSFAEPVEDLREIKLL